MPVITRERVLEAARTLMKYRAGKRRLENRVRACEEWWKKCTADPAPGELPYASAWLFNSVINRHADAIQMYPMPNILPRESGDKDTAVQLSAIIPCILDQNGFEETYSAVMWQKMKQGTGIYGIFWDPDLMGGMGDIAVKKIDIMNLFWEPGITDIQDSENVFLVTPVHRKTLAAMYPGIDLKKCGNEFMLTEYPSADKTDQTDRVLVVDWYYREAEPLPGGGFTRRLQYCRFAGDTVLYASADDDRRPTRECPVTMGNDLRSGAAVSVNAELPAGPSVADRGWYIHGQYPFVMDPLFPVEGSPCGFGYIDVGKNAQAQIDRMNRAMIHNAIIAATPRYFVREDGGINETEFADLSRPFVHVNSNLSEDTIRRINTDSLHSNYITILNNKITELKETGNNIDSSNGITNGVTAASGIAAQQEAAGKTSRASTMGSYRAFARVIHQIISLMSQFYDAGRVFRVTGRDGGMEFLAFDHRALAPASLGSDFGTDMGCRRPLFDVKISAQSKTVYTRNSQNELAVSLANLGLFEPNNTDRSLLLLEAMDFDGKEELARKIAAAGTDRQLFARAAQIALTLARRYEPETAEQLSAILLDRAAAPHAPIGGRPPARGRSAAEAVSPRRREDPRVTNARRRANLAADAVSENV